MLDLLLTGGIVADGSGSPALPVYVAVENGRIVHVGPLEPGTLAAKVVDRSGHAGHRASERSPIGDKDE